MTVSDGMARARRSTLWETASSSLEGSKPPFLGAG